MEVTSFDPTWRVPNAHTSVSLASFRDTYADEHASEILMHCEADRNADSKLGTPTFTNTSASAQQSEATSMGASPKTLLAETASIYDHELEDVEDLEVGSSSKMTFWSVSQILEPEANLLSF